VDQKLIPAREARARLRVANSRFIATVAPAFSVDEARAFIDRIKAEFDDATHNVPAFVIGHGATVTTHCSDDGEPSGTAGPPTLAVLQGSGLGDVAVVVTRYFGGTKLGTGGLVKAYSAATREVLARLPRAVKLPTHTVRIDVHYRLYERLLRLVARHRGQTLEEAFAGEVTVIARLPQQALPAFRDELQELSGGRAEPRIVASSESTIVPLPTN